MGIRRRIANPLGDRPIGTSATFGWRSEVELRESIQHDRNRFVAVAERSFVIGYEALIAAAEITP